MQPNRHPSNRVSTGAKRLTRGSFTQSRRGHVLWSYQDLTALANGVILSEPLAQKWPMNRSFTQAKEDK